MNTMIEALRNHRSSRRPRSTMRRRGSRPIVDDSDIPESCPDLQEMKYWLSLLKLPDVREEEIRETGRTPIFFATMSKSSSEISQVLARTPDINITDKSGQTPLHMAVENNNVEAVRLFMTRKPNLSIRNNMGDTPLHVASATKNIRPEIVQAILVGKRCLNAKNTYGLTPLHVATINNNIELMADYLDRGAKVDMVDNENGWTPLHHATMAHHSKAVSLLLKYGANPNIADQYGQSPLFNAVMGDDLRMVIDIVTHSANIYICDSFGQTPIHLAARNSIPSILSWFLTHWFVNIDCQNYRGQTLLHCAIEDNRNENIKAILQREPDLDIRDHKELTAFDLRHDNELIKHVIKMKVAKLPVSKRILDIVYNIKDPEFIEKHEKYCYEELEQMKKILFPGLLISYYKFTFSSLQKRAEYMMNKKVLLYSREPSARDSTIQCRFPIYWGTIERRYFEARDRRGPLERFENEKDRIFGCLPDHCVSNILSYLDTKDIIKILKAL